MDGGAEVYLAFDFRRVFARKYAGPGGNELALDIYDMGSPEEAFGIFSCDRGTPAAGIGQDSEYGFGLLRFQSGPVFRDGHDGRGGRGGRARPSWTSAESSPKSSARPGPARTWSASCRGNPSARTGQATSTATSTSTTAISSPARISSASTGPRTASSRNTKRPPADPAISSSSATPATSGPSRPAGRSFPPTLPKPGPRGWPKRRTKSGSAASAPGPLPGHRLRVPEPGLGPETRLFHQRPREMRFP